MSDNGASVVDNRMIYFGKRFLECVRLVFCTDKEEYGMCDEHAGLNAFESVLKTAYAGVLARIEEGLATEWRLPSGIAEEFRSRMGVEDYRVLCYGFIERVVFPSQWNNLDQIKFFGDVMTGERDDTGVLVCV